MSTFSYAGKPFTTVLLRLSSDAQQVLQLAIWEESQSKNKRSTN